MSDLPSPKKHKTSNWSAIWVLPLVALAIGAWLGWRAYDQAGVLIQVRFESSDGIQAKKTEVLYKGIAVRWMSAKISRAWWPPSKWTRRCAST